MIDVIITRDPFTGAVSITPPDGYVIDTPHVEGLTELAEARPGRVTAEIRPRRQLEAKLQQAEADAEKIRHALNNTPERPNA